MTAQTFQPGQRVRFRLGERGPVEMPCCGQYLDLWEYLKDFSGQTFKVGGYGMFCCPLCKTLNVPTDNFIPLEMEVEVNGISYRGFGAYPQELELVSDEGQPGPQR